MTAAVHRLLVPLVYGWNMSYFGREMESKQNNAVLLSLLINKALQDGLSFRVAVRGRRFAAIRHLQFAELGSPSDAAPDF